MKKQLFKSNSPETHRMFKSDFLEFFSKCPWWLPIVYWGVLVTIFMYLILNNTAFSSLSFWGYLGLGFLIWSILEYTIHRFVFHWKPAEDNQLGQRIHFVIHGVHHDFPNDRLRLVTPPSLSTMFGIPVFFIYWSIFGDAWVALLVLCGSIIGFVLYDTMHFYLHHGKINSGWLKKLQADHLSHHYTDEDKNFGVSPLGVFWDNVFRTHK